jgi:hypothetical protein
MNAANLPSEELAQLISALLDDDLSAEDHARLTQILADDAAARDCFYRQVRMHAQLSWNSHPAPANWLPDNEATPAAVERPSATSFNGLGPIVDTGEATTPAATPILGFLGTAVHGTVDYFSSGWPAAYLVATVVFGLGLLVGALVHVSEPAQVARQSTPLAFPPSPLPSIVGRITGMVDCQWETEGLDWGLEGQRSKVQGSKGIQSLISNPQSLVSLGDKFALSSGLMEITYDTGAKVILQGPVTYEVESKDGGFLSVGKLTARMEKRGEGKGRRGEGERNHTATKSENSNQESEVSPLSPPSSPLFSIRTPTATVTDLGTEFGVEVDRQGVTTSHVFRGLVRVQMVGSDGKAEGEAQTLHENQSARVESRDGNRAIVVVSVAKSSLCVREIPKLTTRSLDLVDVVAGGDGFSDRRNRGIDPRSGQTVDTQPVPPQLTGDHQYHRVESLPFVDGVFIPHGGKEPVPIDSAGHVFADFGTTNNRCWGHIWAGGPIVFDNPSETIPTVLGGIDYASAGHGVLAMLGNKGITFDLDAIRKANPACKLVRFRSLACNMEIVSQTGRSVYADLRVLVDGQVRFQRREINAYNGAMSITIPLVDRDRFLTLATSDAGNGTSCDWIVFGDPRIELAETVPN